jgi:hypothetical protein
MSCSANNFRAKSFSFLFGSWLALALQLPAVATQSVTLGWNPSTIPNVASYRIYYGTVSQNYSHVVAVGNVTNAVISGLADGTTFFFAATTTDTAGDESAFSNEASFSTAPAVVVNQPPTLNSLTNVIVYKNAGLQAITLTGISSGSPTENQVLKVTATTANTSLTGTPTVAYTSPNSTGTLVFKPSATLTGSCKITVMVNDGGKSNNIIVQTFSVTVVAPPNPNTPKFAQPLTNTVATVGQTIALRAVVTGKAPFRYQWKYNLTTATSATLTLKNVKASQTGSYSVTVANAYGSTNSGNALLSVMAVATPVNQITIAPVNPPTAAAATLTSAKQANGQFAFLVTGTVGSNYVVQASSDLKTWSAVATNAAPFTFNDPNASSFSQRFYRAYFQP